MAFLSFRGANNIFLLFCSSYLLDVLQGISMTFDSFFLWLR